MANKSASPLLAFIRRIAAAGTPCELTDGELLQRFAVQGDQWAFAALMHRHGPMVLGVCQSVLQNVQDAEDAFQATFLVLVRKSRGVVKPASVASWLHGVAYRLAMKARTEAARRRTHEKEAATAPTKEPQEEVIWRDLRPILHEEVDRLPDRYRLPFLLCYLEGKTNEEAAHLLGWPKGTVQSSLARARERLRARLARRGLALTSALLGTLLSQKAGSAAMSAALAESTLKAALLFAAGPGASSAIAAPVLACAEGMLQATLVAKLKCTAVLLLALAAAGTGAGVCVYQFRTEVRENGASGSLMREQPPQRNQMVNRDVSRQIPDDKDRLQGAWTVTSAQQRGREIDVLNDRRLAFGGNRFTLSARRGEVSGIIPRAELEGDFTLEPAHPQGIDLGQRSWRLRGIYRLDRDTLKLCLSEVNQTKRPLDFTTSPSSRQLLLVLERQ
jgi:RNA polymerase sigma factor (sigma-70 family)